MAETLIDSHHRPTVSLSRLQMAPAVQFGQLHFRSSSSSSSCRLVQQSLHPSFLLSLVVVVACPCSALIADMRSGSEIRWQPVFRMNRLVFSLVPLLSSPFLPRFRCPVRVSTVYVHDESEQGDRELSVGCRMEREDGIARFLRLFASNKRLLCIEKLVRLWRRRRYSCSPTSPPFITTACLYYQPPFFPVIPSPIPMFFFPAVASNHNTDRKRVGVDFERRQTFCSRPEFQWTACSAMMRHRIPQQRHALD